MTNGDTLLAELLAVALRQRDQAVEQVRLASLRVKELEAAEAEKKSRRNGKASVASSA